MDRSSINRFSNFMLALLIAIFLIVLTFKVVEYYNLKYVIFEKENVVKVKLEIESDFNNDVLILEKTENIEEILKIRNDLRKYEDPMCECIPVDLHFTIYTLEGREIYEGFDNIKLNDMLNNIYETEEIKKRIIPIFKFDENEIMEIKIVNSITGEEIIVEDLLEDLEISDESDDKNNNNLNARIKTNKKIIYSKTEIIDSIIASMKEYYLKRNYINEDDVKVFDVFITLKNSEVIEANIYNEDENSLDIISMIDDKLLINLDDLEYCKITFKDKTIYIEDEMIFRDIFKRYVDYNTIESEVGIEYKLKNNTTDRVYFGSILKKDMIEELYSMFE